MVPWQLLLIKMDPQTKECNLDMKEKANGSVVVWTLDSASENACLVTSLPLSAKRG